MEVTLSYPPAEADEPTAHDRLDEDSLAACLSLLDGYALGRALCVCKKWRETAVRDDLWGAWCQARWRLPPPRRSNRGARPPRLGEGEARTWLEMHRVYHRRKKPPRLTPVVSDREVVYARGVQCRVGCWLFVTHQPACLLPPTSEPDASHAVLRVRVIVQNLRRDALLLTGDALAVVFRDRPSPVPVRLVSGQLMSKDAADLPTAAGRPEAAADAELAEAEAKRVAAAGGNCQLRLLPLEVALLECEVPALAGMRFEPDALEACESLLLRATDARDGSELPVSSRFDADEIWTHYELIARDFWVHEEEKENGL